MAAIMFHMFWVCPACRKLATARDYRAPNGSSATTRYARIATFRTLVSTSYRMARQRPAGAGQERFERQLANLRSLQVEDGRRKSARHAKHQRSTRARSMSLGRAQQELVSAGLLLFFSPHGRAASGTLSWPKWLRSTPRLSRCRPARTPPSLALCAPRSAALLLAQVVPRLLVMCWSSPTSGSTAAWNANAREAGNEGAGQVLSSYRPPKEPKIMAQYLKIETI